MSPRCALADPARAGGGIVFDSDPYDEWMETMNKLGANIQCINTAETLYTEMQASGASTDEALTADKPAASHTGSAVRLGA
jgi:hypothetical protein